MREYENVLEKYLCPDQNYFPGHSQLLLSRQQLGRLGALESAPAIILIHDSEPKLQYRDKRN